jgi:beta-galactosidase
MNSWGNIQAGTTDSFQGGAWAIYRCTFLPFASVQAQGGTIIFKSVTGSAEVYEGNHLLAEKKDPAPGELEVPLAPQMGNREITVLVNSNNAPRAGFSDVVVVK